MELIFEIVIETILELLLDTSIEGATTNKYPKLIRYIMTAFVILILVFVTVIGGIAALGIAVMKNNLGEGITLFCVGMILLFGAVWKIKHFQSRE